MEKYVLFITSRYYHEQNILSGGVVGTLMSNFGLEKAFQHLGIPFCRAGVGDRYVLEKMHKKGWSLGGEVGEALEDLVKRADKNLYLAKERGRNQQVSLDEKIPVCHREAFYDYLCVGIRHLKFQY